MEKPMLIALKRQDQMDKVLSSLQEIAESGTSVIFSFSTSGQVTVLLASPPVGAKATELCRRRDRNVNQNSIGPSSNEDEIG